jgi:hypothetical protein
MFQQNDVDTLGAGLTYLLGELSYQSARAESIAHLSLLRTACVELAATLSNRGVSHAAISDWLEEAKSDPLPEVRIAVEA